ncbi:bifunctional GNAT family N-acetyltransferase/GrpB family protein [Arthrobacter alpinus]|nr:bifunctional GNAT family N-acetyltransferase/GrpB family protein [Arthrobacter alpinus]
MPRPEGDFVNYEPDGKSLGDALAPGQLVIRQAVVADIPRIVETNEQSGQDSVGLFPLAAAISDEARLVVVACADGVIVGWAKTHFWAQPDELAPAGHYLGGVSVKPEWRRRGIGTALTETRLAWIWERASTASYVVNAANLASIDMHARWGFRMAETAVKFHTTEFLGGVGLLMSACRPRRREDVTEVELMGGVEYRKLELRAYDPCWPVRYEVERNKIESSLGGLPVSIDHVGSTSVRGLAAKDVIDILITVPDITDEEHYVKQLVSAGYEMRVREPGHRLLRTPARDVHIHVNEAEDGHAADKLRFRDQLRRSDNDRKLYESTKKALLRRDWVDMNAYADAKTDVIREILSHTEPTRSGQ